MDKITLDLCGKIAVNHTTNELSCPYILEHLFAAQSDAEFSFSFDRSKFSK